MISNEQSSIERIVMTRVHRITLLRPFISGSTLSIALFAAALWGIGRAVWVSRVFENMPQGDMAAFLQFMLSAFGRTDLVVQILTLAALVSLVYLAHAFARAIGDLLTLSRV